MTKTLIGTATTDANGVATITYTATDVGDITIQAESDNLKSNIINIASLFDSVDMITVDSMSSAFINITLHDFYTTGYYTCNVFDANDHEEYSNDRIRTDPFSFRTSVLTFPVTIYLFDSYMKLLQTKTIEFDNNSEIIK